MQWEECLYVFWWYVIKHVSFTLFVNLTHVWKLYLQSILKWSEHLIRAFCQKHLREARETDTERERCRKALAETHRFSNYKL